MESCKCFDFSFSLSNSNGICEFCIKKFTNKSQQIHSHHHQFQDKIATPPTTSSIFSNNLMDKDDQSDSLYDPDYDYNVDEMTQFLYKKDNPDIQDTIWGKLSSTVNMQVYQLVPKK